MKRICISLMFFVFLNNIYAQDISAIQQKGKIIYAADINEIDSRIIRNAEDLRYDENIIGWSPNGYVAFKNRGSFGYYSFNYGPNGLSIIKVVIFNAIEDIMLEEFEIKYNENTITEEYKRDSLNKFNTLLQKYNINRRMEIFENGLPWTMAPQFPFRIGNRSYDCWLEATIENYGDYGEAVINWKLVVNNGTNNNTVATGKNAATGYGPGVSQILGYYKSPYEDRIIIVVRHFQRSFEGDIYQYIEYYGCHLGVGF
jgi:hypothetical protein